MEAVLTVYQQVYNPDYPVVCLDEASKQLVKETLTPIPARLGQPARIDYKYERNGTANLFMLCEPMTGWRRVQVTASALTCGILVENIGEENKQTRISRKTL